MSRGPSREAKCPSSFLRERTKIVCACPMMGHCGRPWQIRRSRRTVGFLASIATIKPKGSPLGFHTLPSCLRIYNLRRQSPRLPASMSQPPSSSPPPTPIFQWIRGAALTSPSSAWRASSIAVFSALGPRPRSGCCPTTRIHRRRLTATWCRSPTSTSVGSRPPPTNFFGSPGLLQD